MENMRVTLDLSDEAHRIAKTIAHRQGRAMGAVVSDFITGRLEGAPSIEHFDANLVFPTFRTWRPTTTEDVIAARDDDE